MKTRDRCALRPSGMQRGSVMKRTRMNRWLLASCLLPALLAVPVLAVDDCPDAWISTKISMRLSTRIGVYAARINPNTELCVVTLRGCVKKEKHRQRALVVAGKTKYVKQVIDEMKTCDD